MATSGDSDDKILLFNNNRPLNPIGCSFEKINSQKNISYKDNKEDLINKVKCFTENNNHKVWSATKFVFWFAKDQHWVEIK